MADFNSLPMDERVRAAYTLLGSHQRTQGNMQRILSEMMAHPELAAKGVAMLEAQRVGEQRMGDDDMLRAMDEQPTKNAAAKPTAQQLQSVPVEKAPLPDAKQQQSSVPGLNERLNAMTERLANARGSSRGDLFSEMFPEMEVTASTEGPVRSPSPEEDLHAAIMREIGGNVGNNEGNIVDNSGEVTLQDILDSDVTKAAMAAAGARALVQRSNADNNLLSAQDIDALTDQRDIIRTGNQNKQPLLTDQRDVIIAGDESKQPLIEGTVEPTRPQSQPIAKVAQMEGRPYNEVFDEVIGNLVKQYGDDPQQFTQRLQLLGLKQTDEAVRQAVQKAMRSVR